MKKTWRCYAMAVMCKKVAVVVIAIVCNVYKRVFTGYTFSTCTRCLIPIHATCRRIGSRKGRDAFYFNFLFLQSTMRNAISVLKVVVLEIVFFFPYIFPKR